MTHEWDTITLVCLFETVEEWKMASTVRFFGAFLAKRSWDTQGPRIWAVGDVMAFDQ